MAKQWDKLAAKARKIAKNIVTGEEEYKGTRLTAIVYRLDTFATDALNRKYARQGSQASIHTEWEGIKRLILFTKTAAKDILTQMANANHQITLWILK